MNIMLNNQIFLYYPKQKILMGLEVKNTVAITNFVNIFQTA